MNRRMTYHVLATLLLATTAGTTMAQTEYAVKAPGVAASSVEFWSCHKLSERDIVNNNGEEIAELSDLILDRGSGRIEYLIIKTGTTLGMGGRAIAIPYAAFRWESGKDRFVLASTSEQLTQFPEYTPEDWKAIKEWTKDPMTQQDKNSLRNRMATDAAAASDPYSVNLDTAKKAKIEGEITQVDRVRTSTFGEQVVISVKTADGATRKIAMGPSWYINGTSAAPMRGDKVAVDTLALPRDPDELLAGTHLRNGERELHLRNSDGSAAWALKSVDSGGRAYSTAYSRYLLLSHLTGMKVDCRGEECGKVNDVIFDRISGEIGFLSIDPNKNFLGISDTKRMIPWSVANVTLDGVVRIDASKEMVMESVETPSDITTLNSGTHAERVYRAFGVPAPRFQAAKPITAVMPGDAGPWGARGGVINAMEPNTSKIMSGKVIDVSEIKFEKGAPSAHAVRIQLDGDGNGQETILLGPTAYMENQKAMCRAGDMVKIDACRTTVDGSRHWIAKSIECKNARLVLVDGNNAPAWAQR